MDATFFLQIVCHYDIIPLGRNLVDFSSLRVGSNPLFSFVETYVWFQLCKDTRDRIYWLLVLVLLCHLDYCYADCQIIRITKLATKRICYLPLVMVTILQVRSTSNFPAK